MASKDNGGGSRSCTETRSVPHCVVLPSALTQIPFLKPISPNFASPNNIIKELHDSAASTADNLFRFLNSLASQNPILKKLSSLPSDFNRFTQVCFRNHNNVSFLSSHNFAAILPGDSVAGLVVANGLSNFLNLYNTVLVCRLVLTWFPNAPPAIVGPLSTVCDPYLNIFRGIIPPLGGTLDLSPILAFLVLNAFTSTAAALPAELPKAENAQENLSALTSHTPSEDKWMKRVSGSRSKKL